MHILVTNDDGYYAPGLKSAIKLAQTLSDKVSVIAPATERSGVGHAVTYTLPMSYHKMGERHFALEGNPADCVLVAENLLGEKPDLVISGVNRGHNLGPDLLYSGTVGAAIEATAHGIPAISLSQKYGDTLPADRIFEVADEFALKAAKPILEKIFTNWPKGKFANINFPSCEIAEVAGITLCDAEPLAQSNMMAIPSTSPSGKKVFWLGHPGPIKARESGKDVELVNQNHVTVSFCQLDLNDAAFNQTISGLYDES